MGIKINSSNFASKNKHRIIVIILGILVLLSSAVVKKFAMNRAVTVSFAIYSGNNWGVPENAAYAIYDEAKAMFESLPENKHIKIQLITGTLYRDYSEWFAQKVLKGQEPDLFLIKEDDFNVLASVGILQNLDSYIRNSTYSMNSFYTKSIERGSFEGSQFSLPISVVPSFLIVNKTLLEREHIKIDREHWTWEQFYNICKALTQDTNGDGIIDRFGVYGYSWQDAFYSDGQVLFDQDGSKLVFDNNAMIEIIAHLKRMYDLNRGTVIKPEDFDKGHVGFKPFNLSEYRVYGSYPYRILKYSNFEWEVVPFPHGPRGQSLSKLYTVQVGMSSRCKHKTEAFSFLEFLSNDLGFQSKIWEKTNSFPANRNVIPYLGSNPKNENDVRILSFISDYNIMENLYIDPPFKWYDDIDSFITQRIFQIIATDADIKDSIPILKKEIDKRLSELRE